MTSYIAPEYEELENSLSLFLNEHDLDQITVSSLIRGGIEILEEELPKASIITIDESNPTTGVSIKARNIKINFKFAINSIFSSKLVNNSEGIWLILAFLKAMLFLLDEATIHFDANDALVVFCLYQLQGATPEKIVEYAKKLKEKGVKTDIQIIDVQNALENLQKIRTVKLENGNYVLCETVLLRRAIKTP